MPHDIEPSLRFHRTAVQAETRSNQHGGGPMTGKISRNGGVSLLEVTMAVAIFAVAVGVAAQGLISFYASMDVQNQRVMAANQCRALLSDMRNIRDANPNSSTIPTNFRFTP